MWDFTACWPSSAANTGSGCPWCQWGKHWVKSRPGRGSGFSVAACLVSERMWIRKEGSTGAVFKCVRGRIGWSGANCFNPYYSNCMALPLSRPLQPLINILYIWQYLLYHCLLMGRIIAHSIISRQKTSRGSAGLVHTVAQPKTEVCQWEGESDNGDYNILATVL